MKLRAASLFAWGEKGWSRVENGDKFGLDFGSAVR